MYMRMSLKLMYMMIPKKSLCHILDHHVYVHDIGQGKVDHYVYVHIHDIHLV